MSIIDDLRELQTQMEIALRDVARHEEQINGQRGMQTAIDQLVTEVKGLRKAAYWVAGVIVAGAITFAFSVLTLFGGV